MKPAAMAEAEAPPAPAEEIPEVPAEEEVQEQAPEESPEQPVDLPPEPEPLETDAAVVCILEPVPQ